MLTATVTAVNIRKNVRRLPLLKLSSYRANNSRFTTAGVRQFCVSADAGTDNAVSPTEGVKSALLGELIARGYMYQCTDLCNLDNRILMFEQYNPTTAFVESSTKPTAPPKPVTMYVGFDATASSLHAGSLIQLMLARTFLRHGHRVICLLGGGTTKIGDPSGKDTARQMLTEDVIEQNCQSISTVFRNVLGCVDGAIDDNINNNNADVNEVESSNRLSIRNNSEWLDSLNYISFLRDFGSQFSVNRMLSLESVKLRLNREQPLSFLEFNYSILQAYDFHHLFQTEDVEVQIGGSDQWGNIVSGVELINKTQHKKIADERKLNKKMKQQQQHQEQHNHGVAAVTASDTAAAAAVSMSLPHTKFKQVYGLTTPLLTTSNGMKMGKSVNPTTPNTTVTGNASTTGEGHTKAQAQAQVQGGTIWLDRNLYSVFNYWNFWRSCTDADVFRFLKLYTEIPVTDIMHMEQRLETIEGSQYGTLINSYKEILADEATKLLHACSETEIAKIHAAAKRLYASSSSNETDIVSDGAALIPKVKVAAADLKSADDGSSSVCFTDLLVLSNLAKSKNEARRLISSGAVRMNNDVKVQSRNDVVTIEHFQQSSTSSESSSTTDNSATTAQNKNEVPLRFLLSCGKKKHVYVELMQ